jgi:hypothetical protein
LANCRKLTKLFLQDCTELCDDSIHAIAAAQHQPLEELNLADCVGLVDIADAVLGSDTIKIIHIRGCELNPDNKVKLNAGRGSDRLGLYTIQINKYV